MVFSRKIFVAVIMAVNLVMLLHAVLPHHHHEEEVCFSESHCEDTAVIIDLECVNDPAHEHDVPGEKKACNVIHAYLLPELNGNYGKSDVTKLLRSNMFFLLVPVKGTGEVLSKILFPDFYPPASICSLIANNSLSLRGPPSIA